MSVETVQSNGSGAHAGRATSQSARARCAMVIALLATVSISGCSRPVGDIFPKLEKSLAWPLPPDAARIRYVGEIHGVADLKPSQSGWEGLQRAFGTPKAPPMRLVTPQAVVVSDDDVVYVVDTGAAALHIIDLVRRKYALVQEFGTDDRLTSPVGVALGRESVFVTDAVLGAVLEFTKDGTFLRKFSSDIERPGGIAYCAKEQRLFVVDTARHQCVAFDEGGRRLFTFGTRGVGDGDFNYPTHVACSELLGVLISDTLNFRIARFGPDGSFINSVGQKGDGAGDLSLPKGVAVDGDGNLYVVDAHFENVQMFRADGRLLLAFGEEGSGQGQFSIPAGIAVDHHNRIWVADAHNSRLQVFQYLGRSEG